MRKILIVSSDKRLLTLLNRELTIRNYTVLPEDDPDKTFIHIGEFAPDLLVVDLILDEHNGGAISRQVKCNPHTHDLPIIVLSAYEPESRYASRFGCDRVIQKTANFYPLLHAVNDLLEESEVTL